ncbi:hypothetical protein [Haloparvum sedimenti]|uniref:hypothetical protein n=1 Tax=Haloparvum sedimenti TaxID=1678448 RepID=UPI001C4001CF|nr:hypothetical protein [Haloparvum sedimenti]
MSDDDPTGRDTVPHVPDAGDEPTVPVDDRPFVESRTERLAAFLRHNRDRLVVDAALLLAWIVASAGLFGWLGLPQWLHYLVLLVGIAAYALATPTWERPYRSG